MEVQREVQRQLGMTSQKNQRDINAGLHDELGALQRLSQGTSNTTSSSKANNADPHHPPSPPSAKPKGQVLSVKVNKFGFAPPPAPLQSPGIRSSSNNSSPRPGGPARKISGSPKMLASALRAGAASPKSTGQIGFGTNAANAGAGRGVSPGRQGSFRMKDRASISLGDGAIVVNENGMVSTAEQEKLMDEIVKLRKQLQSASTERDRLASDRKQWMSRIQGDNHHLASMLRNVRDAKQRLVVEMDAVQAEKGKYRSMQLQLQNNDLKSAMYPLDNEDCVISEARRSLLNPPSRQEEAERLHGKLTALVSQVHENVMQLNEMVTKKVDSAINDFVEFRPEGVAKTIEELTNIASSSAYNIGAAESVAKSLSEAMVGALLNKSQAILQMRAQSGIEEAQKLALSAESNATQAKSLITQNESLKSNLASMRKKYSQLLDKVTKGGVATHAGGGGEHVGSGAAPITQHTDKHSSNNIPVPRNGKNVHSAKDYNNVNIKVGKDGEISLSDIMASTKAGNVGVLNPFETLPFEVKQVANTILSEIVSGTASVHPLAKEIKQYALKESIAEVGASIQPQLGVALHACKLSGLLTFDGSQSSKLLEESVRKAIRSPLINKQIVTQVHLIVTYLYQRSKVTNPAMPEGGGGGFIVNRGIGRQSSQPEVSEEKKSDTSSSGRAASSSSTNTKGFSNVKPAARSTPGKPKPASAQGAFTVKGANPKSIKQVGNVFMASTGEEQVTTLAPPEDVSAKKKNVPAFMQPVPKKVSQR